MSVQKFVVTKESSNFTIVPNKVIQGIKDLEILGLYVYLLSLPPQWTFYKTQLKEQTGFGIKKLERYLSTLVQMHLIEIVQRRNEKGHFAHFDLCILNGELFEINNLKDCAPRVINRTTVNRTTDMGSYKRNIDKINKDKKIKSYCASDDARTLKFNDFWSLYPVRKNKARAMTIWRNRNLDLMADKICTDIRKRMTEDYQWHDPSFIPHPSTYLRNERWNDEMTPCPRPEQKKIHSKPEVSSSNPPFYGPGHPTWDSIHGRQQ